MILWLNINTTRNTKNLKIKLNISIKFSLKSKISYFLHAGRIEYVMLKWNSEILMEMRLKNDNELVDITSSFINSKMLRYIKSFPRCVKWLHSRNVLLSSPARNRKFTRLLTHLVFPLNARAIKLVPVSVMYRCVPSELCMYLHLHLQIYNLWIIRNKRKH